MIDWWRHAQGTTPQRQPLRPPCTQHDRHAPAGSCRGCRCNSLHREGQQRGASGSRVPQHMQATARCQDAEQPALGARPLARPPPHQLACLGRTIQAVPHAVLVVAGAAASRRVRELAHAAPGRRRGVSRTQWLEAAQGTQSKHAAVPSSRACTRPRQTTLRVRPLPWAPPAPPHRQSEQPTRVQGVQPTPSFQYTPSPQPDNSSPRLAGMPVAAENSAAPPPTLTARAGSRETAASATVMFRPSAALRSALRSAPAGAATKARSEAVSTKSEEQVRFRRSSHCSPPSCSTCRRARARGEEQWGQVSSGTPPAAAAHLRPCHACAHQAAALQVGNQVGVSAGGPALCSAAVCLCLWVALEQLCSGGGRQLLVQGCQRGVPQALWQLKALPGARVAQHSTLEAQGATWEGGRPPSYILPHSTPIP